jgi:prophage regulatory protein
MLSKLIRRHEVEQKTGLARSTLYDYIARGAFPAPVRLGARAVAWHEADIDDWIASLKSARPHGSSHDR